MEQPGRSRERYVEERRPDPDASFREIHQRIEEDRARVVRGCEPRPAQVVVVVRGQGANPPAGIQLLPRREAQSDTNRERGGDSEEEHWPPPSHRNVIMSRQLPAVSSQLKALSS